MNYVTAVVTKILSTPHQVKIGAMWWVRIDLATMPSELVRTKIEANKPAILKAARTNPESVDFHEKDFAKSWGFRWEPEQRQWQRLASPDSIAAFPFEVRFAKPLAGGFS